ncbi:alpha/beta fold hydrolase, partial [Streptomyces sp. NPDC053513]|uniref:alpha/beta fold hydrolase n=1 Tax=Streptomyces sp. NPDC053513 TaxID=3365708 RepID=UPI0037CDE0B0
MIPVKDGEVWADDAGGEGLPLVLLHPGVGDSTVWDPVLPELRARYRVIRYDVRGYGRSPAPTAAYSPGGGRPPAPPPGGGAGGGRGGGPQGGAPTVGVAQGAPG